jgi:WD40 repeat protein
VEPLLRKVFTFSDHTAPVYALASGRNSETIYSASGDRFVAEWNLRTFTREPMAVRLEQPAFSVHFIPGHDLLVAGNASGGIHVIDVRLKKEIRYLRQHTGGIYDLKYDVRRNQLLAAGGDGILSVWSIPDFSLELALPVAAAKLRQIAIHENSGLIAVACGDGYTRCLDPAFFNEVYSPGFHEGGVMSVAFHPSKPVLLTGGKDAHLRFYLLADESEVLDLPAHNFALYGIRFSPDGRWCATCSRDKSIKLWDAATFDPLMKLTSQIGGHTHSVNSLIWWGKDHLVSCGDDRKIIVWNTTTQAIRV